MAGILGRSNRTIRRKLLAGKLGKVIEIDGRAYVRRGAFLRALDVASTDFAAQRPVHLGSPTADWKPPI